MSDNKGTPMSILEAANNCIAINWEQPPLGITIDKIVKHQDGTTTIYFTSNCDIKKSVPRVAQHDIDTCCGTTANNVQNLAYVRYLEEMVVHAQQLLDITGCDTLAQLVRHVSGLTKRCEVLTQQVNQLKQSLIDLDREHSEHLDELFGTGDTLK